MTDMSDDPSHKRVLPMGMAYRGNNRHGGNLSRRLAEFAAKRVISEVVRTGVKNAERATKRKLYTAHHNRNLINSSERKSTMFQNSSTRSNTNRSASRQAREEQEPVDVWVNTVVVLEAGAEPVRIGTGRPLSTFKADKPVNTKDEAFNTANATSNALINGLHKRAEELGKGESFMLTADATEEDFVGITLQVYRTDSDVEGDAAAKADIESQAAQGLSKLFG